MFCVGMKSILVEQSQPLNLSPALALKGKAPAVWVGFEGFGNGLACPVG